MNRRLRLASCLSVLVPALAAGQHGGTGPTAISAPPEAKQFDFLVGQWELTVTPRVSSLAAKIHGTPKLLGTWKAWRAFDGWGIEDEMRIVDASGNPRSLAHAMRFYDVGGKQWTTTLLDVYRGRFSTSTGAWSGNAMTITSRGTDPEGHPVVTRTRFYDINPAGFRYQQDRLQDDGKTWDEGTFRVEARRIAATAPR